jgi:uncharacterized membrane protein (DUF373 family)
MSSTPGDRGGLDEEQRDPRVGRDSVTRRKLVFGLALAEDILYAAVALVLVGIAVALLYQTLHDLFTEEHITFARRVGDAINGVLFVVIILEIFRTVLAHLEGGGFQLVPFLIIGVISAVRHILLVGTQSLEHQTNRVFTHTQVELGVNALVALLLVIALVLIRRSPSGTDDGDMLD